MNSTLNISSQHQYFNMKPDFIIAGAGRSGSTYLYNILRIHPDIFMPKPKEITFFNADKAFSRGMKWYESFFKKGVKNKIRGEASIGYMYCKKSPERIFNTLPNIKLIFILRNPIERTYSNYLRDVEMKGENRSFIDILKNPSNDYITPGLYYTHINRFLKFFDESKILILLFEDLINNPNDTLDNISFFLNINKFNRSINIKKSNHSRKPRIHFLQKIAYKMLQNQITDPFLLKYSKKFLKKSIHKLNTKNYSEYPVLSLEAKRMLVNFFKKDNALLSLYLNRDLSNWNI